MGWFSIYSVSEGAVRLPVYVIVQIWDVSFFFINSKRGDSHPTHNSNPTCTRTYIHPPPSNTCWTSNRNARAHHFLLALPLPGSNPTGINTPHNPATDIQHSPVYEDGTDSEFRNVGN